jgi:hypothetical protein
VIKVKDSLILPIVLGIDVKDIEEGWCKNQPS